MSTAPEPVYMRRVRPPAGRGLVRLIVQINAMILLAPGVLVFGGSVIAGVLAFTDGATQAGGRGAEQMFAGWMTGFGGALVGVMMMGFGTLLYLALFIEEHCFKQLHKVQ